MSLREATNGTMTVEAPIIADTGGAIPQEYVVETDADGATPASGLITLARSS